MKLEDIQQELDEIEKDLSIVVDVNNGSQIAEKGELLTRTLPRLHVITSQLKSNIAELTKNFVETNNLFVKPHTEQTRTILIDDFLAPITKELKRAEGFIKSIDATLDLYRSFLSFLRQEMNNLNIVK
jgi:hypothetical protein